MQSPTLMAIPLFVFMAILLEKSGVANDLYDMMHEWWGGLRGGLAIGTVLICVIFAAMSGISGAAVVTMGPSRCPRCWNAAMTRSSRLGDQRGRGWGILIPRRS